MAHKCIKYRLTAEGTVPDFLCLHEDGVGGVYVVPDPLTPSPRDMVMIGFTEDGYETGDFEVISTKADLQAYFTEVGKGWVKPDQTDPNLTTPFDPVAEADWVWERLDALNAEN